MTHKERNEWWQQQDWSLCNAELARRTKFSNSHVAYRRRRLQKPEGRVGDRRENNSGVTKAKLSRRELKSATDVMLASKHGISRERVRQLRKEAGLPSSKTLWKRHWRAKTEVTK